MRPDSRPVLIAAYGLLAAVSVAVVMLLSLPRHDQTAQMSNRLATQVAEQRQSALQGKTTQATQIYRARNFSPIWLNGDGALTEDARATLALLGSAGEEGLPAARYKVSPPPAPNSADTVRANFELQATSAVLRYASDMRWGSLDPEKLFDDVSQSREQDNIPGRLVDATQRGAVASMLRELAPQRQEYVRLKAALKRLRAANPWPTVAPGSSAEALRTLQNRLLAEGYLPPNPSPAPAALIKAALRSYQTDSGLNGDGQLDHRTLALLNIPVSTRANQIAANMERMRWLPRALGERYIMVNVPDASLVVVDGASTTLVSRVVVGAPDKPTPILTTRAVAVTINPAWHVPKSIVQNEIQPKLDGNPNYLEEKNMISRDGEVIQQPGPDNALGTAKFEMPNPFDVYLHDTPSKHAFLSDDRAVSHGCVRVEAIHDLVEKMLGIEHGKLEELIAAGDTVRRPLKEAVPVYIQYWTAIPGGNGRTVFREDVYGRDARMISAMFPQGVSSASSARAGSRAEL